MLYPKYKIILKYYQADVLESTYETQRIISNEKDLQFSFARNMKWEGAFQEFADTFIFIKEDRDYVISKRNDYLSRKDRGTYLKLEYYSLNRDTVTYALEYTGKLKFQNVEVPKLYIECQFEVDSILNRLDIIQGDTVSIEKDGTQYDYDISLAAVYDATKIIQYNNGYYTIEIDTGTIDEELFSGIRLNENETALGETYDPDQSIIYLYEETESINLGESVVRFGFFEENGDPISGTDTIDLTLSYRITHPGVSVDTYIVASQSFTIVDSSEEFDLPIAETIIPIDSSSIIFNPDDLSLNSKIEIFATAKYANIDSLTYFYDVRWSNSDGRVELSTGFGGKQKTSKILADPMSNILSAYELAQGVTVNTDNIASTIYDADEMLITTSRGVKGITPLTYNFSFKDWFNSFKAFAALSLDYINDTIYINPIGDAYDTSVVVDLNNATSVIIRSNDLNIDNLTIGNSGGGSSNFDYGDLDPLSTADYSFGLENEQEKVFINKVRVDGSTINKAAIDFEKVTTSIEDRDEDKDLYFIARDPNETKIQSRFTMVSGVDFEKFGQAINIEFSKSRQLWNWRNYYGHLFTGLSELQLKSWDKNKELVYTDTERVDNIVDTPDSITDISDDGSSQITPIFGNNLYICEIPQTSGTYSLIKANKNKRFKVNYDGVDYVGWLNKVTLSPLTRGVIEVELIESA